MPEAIMSVHSEKTHPELIEETNRVGVDFLRIEAEAALTFLQVAETTGSDATRDRNYHNASEGYRTLLQFLPRVVLDPKDAVEIRMKLEYLKLHLELGGYSLET
jgi:hypothetical protein